MAAPPFEPGEISAETASFNADLAKRLAEAPTPMDIPIPETRQARAEGRGLFPPAGPLEGSTWQEIPAAGGRTARVRLSEPAGTARGVYLHIHGGGWTIGAPDQYDRYNQRIAAETGLAVASVEYRLAPENAWPAAPDDAEAAALWALEAFEGPVMIGGESAGAHLSAITALRLREAGKLARIAGLVLNYGCFELGMTPSMRRWGRQYLILSTPVVGWFVQNLLAGQAPAEASPLNADLTGLPPALFQVGTRDPLLDDSLFMAARWQAAGNRAKLAVVPGGVHAFDCFDLEIARAAHRRQDDFLTACLG